MLRTWNYRWWKPIVGAVLAFVGAVIVLPALLLPVLLIGTEGGPLLERIDLAKRIESIDPVSLLYLLLTIGSWILVTWFVMRVIHRMRPRWLMSVMPRMRWKFFVICIGISVVALVAQILVSLVLPGSQEADVTGELNEFTRTTVLLAIVVLAATPLQAAGEEYLFRGYLLQAIGSFWSFAWVPPAAAKWTAILVTSVLFAIGHGVQNFPLFFDRFAFGLIAGYLAIRTGGLEAGIAMHILNNFLAFGFALTFGDISESLNVSETSWWSIVLTMTQAGTYAVLVLLVAKKLGLQTRTNPPSQPPAQVAAYDAPPVSSGT